LRAVVLNHVGIGRRAGLRIVDFNVADDHGRDLEGQAVCIVPDRGGADFPFGVLPSTAIDSLAQVDITFMGPSIGL